MLNFL